MLCVCILQASGSNLGRDISYSYRGFSCFSVSLYANPKISAFKQAEIHSYIISTFMIITIYIYNLTKHHAMKAHWGVEL
jgi:hypothetical protein